MKMKNALRLMVASLVGAALMLTPTNAYASDWGGYANPADWWCGSNYVVRSTPVYGKAADGSWWKMGDLQIKWSNGCPGNYARYATSNGFPAGYVGISIHAQASPYNKAGADEWSQYTVFTRVIRLANSSDRVCAYMDTRMIASGRYLEGSASLCA